MFTAPLFSAFCALATYLFMKEVRGGWVGDGWSCSAVGCRWERGAGAWRAGAWLVAVGWVPAVPENTSACRPAPPPRCCSPRAPCGTGTPPQVRGQGAGLASAALIAVVPSYISRSVAGSYDLEAVAIFALVFVFYLYVKVCGSLGGWW